MNASETLAKRSNKRIIEQKYIDNVLNDEIQNIDQAQNIVFNNNNTASVIRNARSFSVSNGKLTHRHDIRQRFEDMKKLKYRTHKQVPVHNKVIWGHYNNIVFRMAYGLTEDAKNQIVQNHKLEI